MNLEILLHIMTVIWDGQDLLVDPWLGHNRYPTNPNATEVGPVLQLHLVQRNLQFKGMMLKMSLFVINQNL